MARRTREVNLGDGLFKGTTATFATLTVVILFVVAVALTLASRPTIVEYGARFITGRDWNPAEGHEQYGALPFIFGTLVSSALALVMAVPISLGVAIFLAELAPTWLRTPMSFLVELL